MLAAGTPNQALAGELFISLDTVKARQPRLGQARAANRTEAVARARDLGLLPWHRAPIRWHLRASGPPQKIPPGMCTFG
jgi:hypothetical protein